MRTTARLLMVLMSLLLLPGCGSDSDTSPQADTATADAQPGDGDAGDTTGSKPSFLEVLQLRCALSAICGDGEPLSSCLQERAHKLALEFSTVQSYREYYAQLHACLLAVTDCDGFRRCEAGSNLEPCTPGTERCDGNVQVSCAKEPNRRTYETRLDCSFAGWQCYETENGAGCSAGFSSGADACADRSEEAWCEGDLVLWCMSEDQQDPGVYMDCSQFGKQCLKGVCVDADNVPCTEDMCQGTALRRCVDGRTATWGDCSWADPEFVCNGPDTDYTWKCAMPPDKVQCEEFGENALDTCEGDVAKICVLGKIVSIDCSALMGARCLTERGPWGRATCFAAPCSCNEQPYCEQQCSCDWDCLFCWCNTSAGCDSDCDCDLDCDPAERCKSCGQLAMEYHHTGGSLCDVTDDCEVGCFCDPDCCTCNEQPHCEAECSCDQDCCQCSCNTSPDCEASCGCDPDCGSPCACDTGTGCQSGCDCDPECTGCTCDTGAGCQSGCICDPDCSGSGCTCDTGTGCQSGCVCDPDCGGCTCDTGTGCQSGCACDPDCGGCPCNYSYGICEPAAKCSLEPCECDPDCSASSPCLEDDHCDSWCPTDQDPDCLDEPHKNGKYCE